MKNDKEKKKEQLVRELAELRQRIAELEGLEAEYERTVRALYESERRYRSLFESLQDVFFRTDTEGNIILTSPSIVQLLGYTEDEAQSLNLATDIFVHPEQWQGIVSFIEENRFFEEFEILLKRSDGSEVWGGATPQWYTDKEGRILGIEGVIRDISKRKQTEEELRKHRENLQELVEERTSELTTINDQLRQEISERKRVEEELKKAKTDVEAANQAKSIFLANMSHELRTPLNAILGSTQILRRDGTLPQKHHDFIETIHRSSEHLLLMINDILDFSKIEAENIQLQPVEFFFSGFLQTIVNIAQVWAEQEGITVSYQCNPDIPAYIYADETRLRQILLNLLNNAVKFTQEGEVEFRVTKLETGNSKLETSQATSPVSSFQFPVSNNQFPVSSFQFQTCIRFEVKDMGPGIPPEHLEEIFQPFQQVGDFRSRARGTGLGLAISQRLADMMDGRLYVESTIGKGSVFWFDVELTAVLQPDKSEEIPNQAVVGFKEQSCKVLLVDDNIETLKLIKCILLPLGFTIEEAVNGCDAIQEALEFCPDLILMDILMPEMDGFEALQRIRQIPDLQHVIVIAMSASISEQTQQKCVETGFHDFLVKPIYMNVLLDKLQHHLHLTWIYEDERQQTRRTSVLEPDIPLPEEAFTDLSRLAKSGDILGIQVWVKRFEGSDSRSVPFIRKISELARTMQIRQIQKIVREYERQKQQDLQNERKE